MQTFHYKMLKKLLKIIKNLFEDLNENGICGSCTDFGEYCLNCSLNGCI